MQRITVLFLLVASLVTIGCGDSYKYEIKTKIDPVYTIVDDEENIIGLEYKLGPFLILDEVEITPIQFRYIANHASKNLDLHVQYADFTGSNNGFYYYLEGSRFGEDETEPTELKDLIKYSDKIPGFVWLIKNEKEVESVNDASESVSRLKKLE